MVTQETVLVAVHVQPPSAVTLILTSSGPRPAGCEVGLMLAEHPFCRNRNVWPAMGRSVARSGPLFVEMSSRTAPSPDPLPPPATVTQPTGLVAVHVQPLVAVTLTRISSGPRPAL